MAEHRTTFASCGGGELSIWKEDPLKKKFDIIKRCSIFETRDEVAGSVSWNEDNKYLACASISGNEVAVVNGEDLTVKERINWKSLFDDAQGGRATCVCFISDQLLVGSSTGTVILWNVDSSTSIRTYEGYTSPITCVSGRVKSSLVVAGQEDGRIVIHNLSGITPLATLTDTTSNGSSKERINQVACSPFDQKLLASCSSSGSVKLWSVESHRLLVTFTQSHSKGANDVVFSPYNRKLMASAGGDGKICLYDVQQRKQLTQISCTTGLCSLLLMKDGVTMVTGGMDGSVYFYNLKNCKKSEYAICTHKDVPVSTMALQKSVHSSRKLPSTSRHGGKTSSAAKVTFQESYPPSLQASVIQTPSPSQGNTVSFISSANTPLQSNGLSSIFSPLDAPATSSFIPKSTGLPSNATPTNTGGWGNDPVMSHDLTTGGGRDTPPTSWPTPLLSSVHSNSVNVFSPLDYTTTVTNRPLSDAPSTATRTSDPSVVTTTQSSAPTTRSATPRQVSPQGHKKPGSPHMKRNTSPTVSMETTKGADSLESTEIIKASGSGMNSSTLLASRMQSHLPSPDMKSTPMTHPPIQLSTNPPCIPLANSLVAPVYSSLNPPTDVSMATTAPPTSGIPAVHMQYLENLIKESHEETYSTVHRDIRNLSTSMLRQFSTLQNQMVLALTAISEKVDRLSDETEQLKHRIDHLTPKY